MADTMDKGKKLKFLVFVPDSGWDTIGKVVRKVLGHEGIDVELVWTTGEDKNARLVRGEADFTVAREDLSWAYHGSGPYQGQAMPNLRAIASIPEPNWLGFAVTHETRLTAIEQIRERKFPLRIPAHDAGRAGRRVSLGFEIDRIFEAYGFTIQDLERWGGGLRGGAIREGNFDAAVYRAYAGSGPVGRMWQEVTNFNNMRFLPIKDDILDELGKKYGLRRGLMPKALFRGMEEDVPTFYSQGRVMYATTRMDEGLAFLIAKSLDEHSQYFLETHLPLSYNPRLACRDTFAPLHSGAERYYSSRGYMK
jgi:TRAP transporter TAXI family solute receptor